MSWSSDDEVAFGPVSKKELKAYLLEPPKIVASRRSAPGMVKYGLCSGNSDATDVSNYFTAPDNTKTSYKTSLDNTLEEVIVVSSDDEEEEFVEQDSTGRQRSDVPSNSSCEFTDFETDVREGGADSLEENKTADIDCGADAGCLQHERIEKSFGIPRTYNFSETDIPSIKLAPFVDSDEEESAQDTTLDYIDKLLGLGLSDNLSDEDSKFEPSSIISGSFVRSPTHYLNPETSAPAALPKCDLGKVTPARAKHTPVKPLVKTPAMKSSIRVPADGREKPIKNEPSPVCFRVPRTPIMTGSKAMTKNIVSPVAMYIKYSPSAPLTRKVQARPMGKAPVATMTQLQERSEDRAVVNIPEVIYRPASRRQELPIVDEVVLPPSLAKFIKKPTVIKHERRIGEERPQDNVRGRLDADVDLSNISVDHVSGLDMSVWAYKEPLKK